MRRGIRFGRGHTSRTAWEREQIQVNQEFKNGSGRRRLADVLVVQEPSEGRPSKILMVIEFVEDEVPSKVAKWWHEVIRPDVVVLLHGEGERSLYSRSQSFSHRPEHAQSSALPTPTDFAILPDPTDHSLSAVLMAARRTNNYDHRIIAEWVRCQSVTTHGGMPWDAEKACKIMDSIASIEDYQLAHVFVARTVIGPNHGDWWVGDGDEFIVEQVHQDLCAPLCWRIPPRGFVIISGGKRLFGPAPATYGLQLVARQIGLTYDPDASFRRELESLRSSTENSEWYSARELFKHRVLTFKWMETAPPLEDVTDLIPAETAILKRLPYHGFLGRYDDATATVQLYQPRIAEMAAALQVAERHLGSVTLLHLSILGLLHLAEDLDGEWWPGFSTGPLNPWTGGLPISLVALVQVVMSQVLARLRDDKLTQAFEAISYRQPPEYNLWRKLKHLSLEQTRAWAVALRRAESTTAIPDLRALLRALDNKNVS